MAHSSFGSVSHPLGSKAKREHATVALNPRLEVCGVVKLIQLAVELAALDISVSRLLAERVHLSERGFTCLAFGFTDSGALPGVLVCELRCVLVVLLETLQPGHLVGELLAPDADALDCEPRGGQVELLDELPGDKRPGGELGVGGVVRLAAQLLSLPFDRLRVVFCEQWGEVSPPWGCVVHLRPPEQRHWG